MIKRKAHLSEKRVGVVGVFFHIGQGGNLWSVSLHGQIPSLFFSV